jgi:hypothetical protein
MGIIKDNDDNMEDESLTFFFDGSKKLNEFVLNNRSPVLSENPGSEGEICKNSVSNEEIPRQARNSNGSILHSAREKVNSDSSVSSSRRSELGEAVVEDSAPSSKFSPLGKCPQDNGASSSTSAP